MGIMKSLYADLSCEEVFELGRHCDERREADISAQDAAMVEAEAAVQAEREREDHERDLAMAEDERCWCKFFESCRRASVVSGLWRSAWHKPCQPPSLTLKA